MFGGKILQKISIKSPPAKSLYGSRKHSSLFPVLQIQTLLLQHSCFFHEWLCHKYPLSTLLLEDPHKMSSWSAYWHQQPILSALNFFYQKLAFLFHNIRKLEDFLFAWSTLIHGPMWKNHWNFENIFVPKMVLVIPLFFQKSLFYNVQLQICLISHPTLKSVVQRA